ncbi:hypothetical protein [Paraburkholderia sp. 40]|uniref:hypothetical protein n=1 Tax=Paraburkholderia sp. 40 TaxID=2991059 RepID=UPI003D1AA02B
MSAADRLFSALASDTMALDEVRERAGLYLEYFPELTVGGWHVDGEPYDRDFDMEQVRVAELFLIAFGKRRQTINGKDEAHSYILKHAVENWTEASGAFVYVATGAFILAALMLGYECRQRPGYLHCQLNIVVDPTIRHYAYSDRPFSPLFPPSC